MSSTYNGPEKRKFERVPVDIILTYRVEKPLHVRMRVGNKEITAQVLDLSESGMSILTDYDIDISTILLIKFTLKIQGSAQAQIANVAGEVRYNILLKQNQYRLGINFTKIDKEDRSRLACFISESLNK